MSDMMSWQAQACFFPILDAFLDSSPSERCWQIVEVPSRSIECLDRFCCEHEVAPLTLFKLAWALVLQCYAGSNSPSFGHLTLPPSELGADSASPCGLVYNRDCHVELEEAGRVIEVLRAIQSKSSGENGASHLLPASGNKSANTVLYNTALQFQELDSAGSFNFIPSSSDVQNVPENHIEILLDIRYDSSNSKVHAYLKHLSTKLSTIAATNVAHTCAKAIESILKDPFQRIDSLNLITKRDLQQLRGWEADFPERIDLCVHELVLQHAISTPNVPAICSWDGQLTYHELEKVTSILACHLLDHGVGPEILVPICFEKSLYAILTMLAILRVGGAFVPLDPSQPQERLEAIIRKANAKLVITSPQTASKFIDITKQTISVSDALLTSLHASLQDRPSIRIKPYNAAFVLFTSGSTGEPKGIVQEHSSVSTSSLAHGKAFGWSSRSRVLQYAAYTFDVSMMDIFTTLIYGGCVCTPSEDDRRSNIIGIMNTMQVNWVLFTPSVANLISPEDLPCLETLTLGGEAVTQENVVRWANAVTLYNCYGPAESSPTTANLLRPNSRGSTIGREFGSALCWLVDPKDHDRLVPIGAVGELLVEGPTLARGYIGDMDKTKAAFIKNPRWPAEILGTRTRRFYKTGDLVRYNSDGSLDFVGRKDFQVKIRGQRVELGDVEYHLSTYPAVALSMASSPKTGAFAKSLVAIIQIRDTDSEPASATDILSLVSNHQLATSGFSIAKLEQFLKSKLPIYMVPTHWFAVEQIPLSVSGKINRKAVEFWLTQLSRDSANSILTNGLSNGPINGSINGATNGTTNGHTNGQNGTTISKENIISFKISSKLASLVYHNDHQAKSKLISQDITLTAIGLDSIQIISLIMFIKQEFTVKLHISVLLHPKATIRSVTQYIEELRAVGISQSGAERSVDLRMELQMYKQQMDKWGRGPSIQNVFLTGGTGFLGSQILFHLCARRDIQKVMVHVRAKNLKDGLQRVKKMAMQAGWWTDSYLEKIEVWLGDLGKHHLGLNSDQWDCLAGKSLFSRRVHAIIHCGAKVHWNSDFSSLKMANVDSTWSLLNIMNETPSVVKFVYISGGYNGPSLAEKNLHMDDDHINNVLPTEYAKTKFISQLLVQEYSQTTIQNHNRVFVVKPSFIIGTPHQGIANTDDFIWRLVASCIEVGSFNEADADSWLFISDVDNVARVVLDCCDAKQNDSSDPVVGITEGLPVREFWSILGRHFGYIIEPLRQDEWLDTIYADIDSKHESHPLWPLIHNLEKEHGKMGMPMDKIPQELKAGTPSSRVEAAIRKNVEYLRGIGFLPIAK
ncbi:24696652-b1e4-47b4-9288-53a86a903fff [Sclerotinia trifoliorum]|uniref:24696652-b1e4-47b4-9288-53a86a903fff n=1 Tax=Sclerotinia trifoliorum TaxID=28548 RepID=A0A8H2W4V8_9HELO|nr:24696652-b1e4-47b4-9288-53a86a903fff [Sclerotinia trifoliorum]